MASEMEIFEHVRARHLTPEEGAEWLMAKRYRRDYDRLERMHYVLMTVNLIAWAALALFRGVGR